MSFIRMISNKPLLPTLAMIPLLFSGVASADPVILAPGLPGLGGPGALPDPSVFCFGVTGGDALGSDGIRIQFQVLNWTGEDAAFLRVQQSTDLTVNTGGMLDGTSAAMPTNDWTKNALSNAGFAVFEANGNLLSGIDLDPNNDFDFADAPALPSPVDSGANALDGFILDFPDLGVGERVVLQWDFFADNTPSNTIGLGLGNLDLYGSTQFPPIIANPFSFGTFQIDRGTNGSIRLATYFSIGTELTDVAANPAAVDLALTDLNAITLPPTSLAASTVPVPAAFWLMLSGLLGMLGVAKKRRQLG